jgi:ABC-2 type transport system ATP-binding protein
VLINALRAVEDAGVGVEDVALRQPKLDEVFLTLTGRSDAEAALEAAAS